MNYKALSFDLRRDCVDIIMAGGGGHIGGDMSVMEILTEIYFENCFLYSFSSSPSFLYLEVRRALIPMTAA